MHDFAIRSRWIESQRNHALIAIALERYRLEHGGLPERLGALVPDFLPEIPAQVVTGEPPRLERLPAPDGTDSVEMTSYRLRSFGDETGLGDPVWFMPSASIR